MFKTYEIKKLSEKQLDFLCNKPIVISSSMKSKGRKAKLIKLKSKRFKYRVWFYPDPLQQIGISYFKYIDTDIDLEIIRND